MADLTGIAYLLRLLMDYFTVFQTTRSTEFSSPHQAVQGLLPVSRSPHTSFYRNSHRTANCIAALSFFEFH